jgi:hypothetical protein
MFWSTFIERTKILVKMAGKFWAHLSNQNKNIRFDRAEHDSLGPVPSFRFFRKSGDRYVLVACCSESDKGARAAYHAAVSKGVGNDDLVEMAKFVRSSVKEVK